MAIHIFFKKQARATIHSILDKENCHHVGVWNHSSPNENTTALCGPGLPKNIPALAGSADLKKLNGFIRPADLKKLNGFICPGASPGAGLKCLQLIQFKFV